MDFLERLLDPDAFMPHGHCYFWTPDVLWLNVGSDAAIALSYYSIPLALVVFLIRRQDLAFRWIFLLFVVFILACGTTHIMAIWTTWVPLYRLEGWLKLLTALASVATAILLWPQIPRLLKLPSAAQLEALNLSLERRIEERTVALAEHVNQLELSRKEMLELMQQHVAEKARAKRSEERLRRVIESTVSGIIMTDAEGRIELVNTSVETMFGYNPGELLGKPIEILVPDSYRAHHPAFRVGFIQEPRQRAMGAGRDLYGQRKDGSQFPVEIGLNPVVSEDGVQVICSVIDISERKASEERFREQADEIAAASRYKSEFLANMSHELRTPLNSVLLLSEQLAENRSANLTSKQVEYCSVIHRCGIDLLALINDILDLSKIEAGRMVITRAPFVTAELAAQARRLFAPQAELRGLMFSVDIEAGCPESGVGDVQRIDQILKNLLANAFKFTNQGAVSVRFYKPGDNTPVPEGMDPRTTMAIAITDSGIGIAPEMVETIFHAFRQADGSLSRQYGGTGLGLAISRRLARLMRGDITLETRLGSGSTFTIWLPTAVDVNEAQYLFIGNDEETMDAVARDEISVFRDLKSTDSAQPSFEGKKLLLADDDVRNIFVMSSLLEDWSFEVLTARTGREALEVLSRHSDIDIVLLDMMMPDLDGYGALQALRSDMGLEIPVLAVTAKALPEDRERCLAAGADGYLAKPVSSKTLLEAIQSWLPKNGGATAGGPP